MTIFLGICFIGMAFIGMVSDISFKTGSGETVSWHVSAIFGFRAVAPFMVCAVILVAMLITSGYVEVSCGN